ncbi:MAG: type II secretion system protein [Fimbriimonadales bacterium]
MKRRGFTLIELLVVIAIIGILAAVLFPVFGTARRSAKIRADSSNMASIYQALKLYREDQGGYPPLLHQVVEYNNSTMRKVDEVRRAYLYRGRVKDINTMTSVLAEAEKDEEVNAVWPTRDERNAGNPGDHQFAPFGTPVTYQHLGIDPTFLNGDAITDPARFYAWDTYDVAPVRNPNNPNQILYELRYVLFWTELGQVGGGPNDSPRQLGYNDPREDTIITWNTFFRSYEGNTAIPKRRNDTYVLYLNGSVDSVDSRDLFERSWRFGQQ